MKYLPILIILVFNSCSNQTEQVNVVENEQKIATTNDTVIGTKNITNEISGSAYRKRATGYYLIVKGDTSMFMPIFSESKENGEVAINLNLSYSKNTKIFRQIVKELNQVLAEATKEYKIDSLKSMSIGRLILIGDMAISLTNEFNAKFKGINQISTSDYNKVSNFLLESSLALELNKAFEPYSISVERISIEKAYFASKAELLRYSKVSRDTVEIPEQILDFMIWIKFKNE